ncbi:hypothetical protein SLEP1_g42798 [Rubroshorea leprosula]|uniref:FBD domain-containing protein n=1 Tax=Rubroshorea leprosula TaxID=152421 RepID=A0AAV5LBF3_9ROSI|nr:hypothetical protein SLEP1_g42798 [Rubroshorea leprosula]
MRDVVRTSVLSTRWRYLYVSVSNLDLDFHVGAQMKANKFCLRRFVDRLFFFRKRSSVHKFHLKWSTSISGFLDPLHLKEWISALIWHGIRELDLFIELSDDKELLLPTGFFTFKTLVVLKLFVLHRCDLKSDNDSKADDSELDMDSESEDLNVHFESDVWRMDSGESGLKVPSKVCLPSLKVLRLCNIAFSNDDSWSRLLSNCPVLEDLHYRFIGNIWKLGICNPTPKRLRMDHCKLGISNPTLKRLHIEHRPKGRSCGLEIVINAPSLVDLDYSISCLTSHACVNIQSLDEARIDFQQGGGNPSNYIEAATDLLRGICNIQKLGISGRALADLILYSVPIPTFQNVTHLAIWWCLDLCLTQLPYLLTRCESLETLVFEHFDGRNWSPAAWYQLEESRASCLSASLKTIEMLNFDGNEHEMEFVKYLLKNARVLESMKIHILGKYKKQVLLLLPPSLFTCETLVVLKLSVYSESGQDSSDESSLKVPASVCLPSLKIVVDAPGLDYLELSVWDVYSCTFLNINTLAKADVGFLCHEWEDYEGSHANAVANLMKAISNIQTFRICGLTLCEFNYFDIPNPGFNNVTYLTIASWEECGFPELQYILARCSEVEIELAKYFLQSAKVLERMEIHIEAEYQDQLEITRVTKVTKSLK